MRGYWITCILLVFGVCVAGRAEAQGVGVGLQPPIQEVVVNGVDTTSGYLVYGQTDLSLGQPSSPNFMQLDRITRSSALGVSGYPSFGVWEHNYKFYVVSAGPAGSGMIDADVVLGQEVHSFRLTSGTYVNLRGDGSTLEQMTTGPNTFIFTSKDGDVTTFSTTVCSYVTYCYYATSTQRRDGSRLYFAYELAGYIYSGNVEPVSRLKWVTNSFGYGFRFNYRDNGSTGVTNQSRLTLASVEGVKTLCPQTPTTCTASTLSTANYSYTGGQLTAVNAAGISRTFTYDTWSGLLRSPFQASYPTTPEFVVEYASPPWGYGYLPLTPTVAKKTDSRGYATTYAWVMEPDGHVTYKATNAVGATTSYQQFGMNLDDDSDRPQARLLSKVTNPENGVVAMEYDTFARVQKVTLPEGNYTLISYDDRGNILSTTQVAKPSAPAPAIISTASYPSSCTPSTMKTCNKTSYTIDPNNYRRSYTWSSLTGGPESGTAGLNAAGTCALSVGVCPQTTTAYGAFTATDGATVYLQTSVTTKIDASSSTVTAFDYSSAKALANNKSVVDVGGTNLVTCFGYDDVGNQISKTLPRAGVTTCP